MVLGMNSGRSGDGHRTNTHQGRREKTRDRELIKPDPPSQTHTIPQQLHKHKVGINKNEYSMKEIKMGKKQK